MNEILMKYDWSRQKVTPWNFSAGLPLNGKIVTIVNHRKIV